jgi:NAD(P)-dependent dehydrogenase (short-subunit alcohol dehydrogenase family)
LKEKIAVITGANSEIGLSTIQRFVEEGACVFITGPRQSEVDAAVIGHIYNM